MELIVIIALLGLAFILMFFFKKNKKPALLLAVQLRFIGSTASEHGNNFTHKIKDLRYFYIIY